MNLMADELPDLDKAISDEIEFVVNKIHFNADWFTVDAYMRLWKRHFTEFLDKNIEIQKSIQALRVNSDNAGEQIGLIIDSLKELRRMLGESYVPWHRKIMAEFLESDIPLELYNLHNISYIGKMSVIKSLGTGLVSLQTRLHLIRSNEKKITAELRRFEKRHLKLSEMLMKASRSESTLRFFLRTANAEELDDLFKTKPLKLNNDEERAKFNEYLGKFRQNLFGMINHLDKKHLDEDILLNSSDSEAFGNFDEKLRQTIVRHA